MIDMDLSGLDLLEGNRFIEIPFRMVNLEKLKLEMCGSITDCDLHWMVIVMQGQLEIINYYHQVTTSQ